MPQFRLITYDPALIQHHQPNWDSLLTKKQNAPGRYDFLTGISAYSSGVRAHEGHEIVRAVFDRVLPWCDGFDRVERQLDQEGVAPVSLCSVELRCPKPYAVEGFDSFNEAYVERLHLMGVFLEGDDNPVGRTNVAPVRNAPNEQGMFAFAYVRPATTDRKVSFVIAGGGEVRGRGINSETIIRYGEVTEEAMAEKVSFVFDVMGKRLNALNLTWEDVRTTNVYTLHNLDGTLSDIIETRVGVASIHGVHRYRSAPPVEGIEFEMDVKGPTWELALS